MLRVRMMHGQGEAHDPNKIRPTNIIIITDGLTTCQVDKLILKTAKTLDKCCAVAWQVEIRFLQVRNGLKGTLLLKQSDDTLCTQYKVRDNVDPTLGRRIGGWDFEDTSWGC
jgi:mannose/fructose/N-acetylgalactosamine-specific phosphotransferase system component IIB